MNSHSRILEIRTLRSLCFKGRGQDSNHIRVCRAEKGFYLISQWEGYGKALVYFPVQGCGDPCSPDLMLGSSLYAMSATG